MAYNPSNPNGQNTMANSLSVTMASNQSTIPVIDPDVNINGQAAQTATINNIIPSTASANATDTNGLGYRSASIQVVSTATGGAFTFEGSNDNTNFVAIPVYNQLILTGTPITSPVTPTSSAIIYQFPINFRYVRLRISTTITGGSIQAFTRFSQTPFNPAIIQVAQGNASNLSATVAGSLTTVSTVTNLSQMAGAAILMGAGPTGTGSIRTTEANIATATTANVASSATSVTVLASAAGRIGAIFYNDSTAIAYLKYGATASTTSYTVQVPANGTHVMQSPLYSGIIDCIWASANGNMRVTSW